MDAANFQAFLERSGNTCTVDKIDDARSAVTFRERGVTYRGIAYDGDPDFLHLECKWRVGAPVAEERLESVLRDVEAGVKIVKLAAVQDDDGLAFIVSAEQLEDREASERVFWRTVDIMSSAADEVNRRLSIASPAANTSSGNWQTHFEEALKKGCHAMGDGAAATWRVRCALALVIAPDGSGTAFCVRSDERSSEFVTNAHVVGNAETVTLYQQSPAYRKFEGKALAKGTPDDVDLALISVPAGNLSVLQLAQKTPDADVPVGVAGYARVQLWAAEPFGEIVPSVHLGTVTAVNADGSRIMHDALAREGNSGSPVFDPATGSVFGVQSAGWDGEEEAMAIGARILAAFLAGSGVEAAP